MLFYTPNGLGSATNGPAWMQWGDIGGTDPPERGRLTDAERDALVVEVIRLHADGLLRLARRHSLGNEDAQDAYQRGLEIFLRHAHRLDPEGAPSWLRTVVKHEAMAVRRVRQRELAPADLDFDRLEASTTPSPDEQVVGVRGRRAVGRGAAAAQAAGGPRALAAGPGQLLRGDRRS